MRTSTAFVGLAATAALVVLGHPGIASAADKPGGAEVETAIRHAVNGKATPADLAIIKNDPQLARTVPVSVEVGKSVYKKAEAPSGKAGAGSRSSTAAGPAGLSAFQEVCRSVDRPITLKSYLGDTLYTWHHSFSWCTANQVNTVEATRVITASPYNRSDYFTEKSSVAYPQALVTDVTFAPVGGPIGFNPTGAGSPYYSHMARSVNLCIAQYSCYASNLPQSKLTIGRDTATVAIESTL